MLYESAILVQIRLQIMQSISKTDSVIFIEVTVLNSSC